MMGKEKKRMKSDKNNGDINRDQNKCMMGCQRC